MGRFATSVFASIVVWASAAPADAQAPKAGDWYEDPWHAGFKVRVPKDWDFVPPQPDEGNVIAKFKPVRVPYISIGANDHLFLSCWLLKFDRREKPEVEDDEGEQRVRTYDDVGTWLKHNQTEVGKAFGLIESEDREFDRTPASEQYWVGKSNPTSAGPGGVEIYFWCMVYEVEPDLEVVLAFNAPAERKYWRKWERPLGDMARSFRRIELAEGADPVAASGTARDRKRAELERAMRSQVGWTLYETENYFVVSNNDDDEFLQDLLARLEAIRAVYAEDYPVEKALAARRAALRRKAEENPPPKANEDTADDEPAPVSQRTVSVGDPMEESRTSVVRVCANRSEYSSYGGPPRSAGYWSASHRELVVYDDKEVGGRNDTWNTLNHEAFHQYIYYFYGSLSPHSWYNEGTGDFYSGYQLDRRGRFELSPNPWRHRLAQQVINLEEYVPLRKFVRLTQAEYYKDPSNNYAQGWSFIYFLRTGKQKRAKGWNSDWDKILDTYLDTLAATGDLEEAVEKAFAGVDFEELEAAWKHYTVEQT